MGSGASIQHHERQSSHALMRTQLLGVRLSYCSHFIESHGGREHFEGLTTRKVCEEIIRPSTIVKDDETTTTTSTMSYCEMLLSVNNDEFAAIVDQANFYVSHTWDSLFLDMCDALENYFTQYNHGGDHTSSSHVDPVLWIDIFSLNQHSIASNDIEEKSSFVEEIPKLMKALGHTVLVLTSWKDPLPLKRSWCLWEIFSSSRGVTKAIDSEDRNYMNNEAVVRETLIGIVPDVEVKESRMDDMVSAHVQEIEESTHYNYDKSSSSNIHFDVALTSKGELEFMEDMIAGAVHHVEHLREIIEVRQSECSSQTDHTCILHALEHVAALDPSDFNRIVFEILRQWIFHKLEATLHSYSLTTTTLNNGEIKEQDVNDMADERVSAAEEITSSSALVPPSPSSPISSLLVMSKKERYWTLKLVLSKLYVSQSDDEHTMKQAEKWLVDSLFYCQTHYGEHHPETLNIQYHLARCYDKQNRIQEALQLYEECLMQQRSILGSDNRDTFRTLTHYGALLYAQGYFDDALPLYEEGLNKRKEINMDLFGISWMHCLANLYYKQATASTSIAGKSCKSLLSLQSPVANMLHSNSTNDVKQRNVATPAPPSSTLPSKNNPKERQQQALTLYLECIDQLKRLLHRLTNKDYGAVKSLSSSETDRVLDHEDERERDEAELLLIKVLFNAAAIYSKQEDYDDALPLYQTCLWLRQKRVGNDHPDTMKTLLNTAVTHFKMNESKEALALYEEYYAIKLLQVGEKHPEVLSALQNIAICHERLKDYDFAMSKYEECLRIRQEVLGPFHPETKSSEKAIEKLNKKIERRRLIPTSISSPPPALAGSVKGQDGEDEDDMLPDIPPSPEGKFQLSQKNKPKA